MADLLPGYTYSLSAQRYRSMQSGRFVARSRITELMEAQIVAAERRMQALSTAFHEGQLMPSVWVVAMRNELRRVMLQQMALAKGGFDQLSQADYITAERELAQQYAKLTGTAQDVASATLSLPQLLNRARGYAGGARIAHNRLRRDMAEDDAEWVRIARRVLDPQAEHCDDCMIYYQLGWQRAKDLIVPGERCQCGGHCRCKIKWHKVPAGDVHLWLGTMRQVVRQETGVVYEHVGAM